MLLDWFYPLANWNPQFFREVKGRLKPRNLTMTAVASLLGQALVMLFFWVALPGKNFKFNVYCLYPDCVRDAADNILINWQLWWLNIFQVFSWALPFILLISGVYLLISDLGKEERRGTLNFIRLSPQTSQSILLGKMLGVPIVPLLAVVLAIPLHLLSAVAGGVSFLTVLSIYLLTIAAAGFYFTGFLLFAFLGAFQGWIGAISVWFSFMLLFQFIRSMEYKDAFYSIPDQFLGISIGNHLALSLAFWLVTFGVATFWLWQAANRRFRNPNLTLLSKQQSYLMTACFEFWLLGFVIRDRSYDELLIHDLASVAFFNLFWFILLIAALTPQRQMLLDWARYRRQRVSSRKQFWNRSVMQDLVWGEKSPLLLAVALNLLVAFTLFTPWIMTWETSGQKLQAFVSLLLGGMVVLICAAIAQLALFMKTQKPAVWAVGSISVFLFAPIMLLAVFSLHPTQMPILWLFSIVAFPALAYATAMEVFFSFLAHLGLFGVLTAHLTRQLQKAGESETKAMLAAAK